MKIKCMHCENIYELEFGFCPSCKGRGGFMQEPRSKQFGEMHIHLEDTLIHQESGNEYQVKEIQANGLIGKCVKSILPQVMDKPVYISNTTVGEYKQK